MDYAEKHIETEKDCDVSEADCGIIEYLLEHCEITVPQENRFFINVNCEGIQNYVFNKRAQKYRHEIEENGLAEGHKALAFSGDFDFGHTSAEWESVISLGVFGLKKRISEYAKSNKGDKEKQVFYRRTEKVYAAALRFIKRASEAAESCGKAEMAKGLSALSEREPETLFEAMQTSIVYYVLQHMIEGTNLRTLGRLDKLFYPYYIKEDETAARRMALDYIKEIDKLKAPSNIPFAICGTDKDGKDLTNKLSYVILEAYGKAQTTNVKFHLLCSDSTPEDIIDKAFRCVRSGNNSIVFMSDKTVIRALEEMGEDHEDAANYHIVGCYECGGNGELTSSCNARVNLPKALELALCGGKDMLTGKLIGLECSTDFESYEALYSEFVRQLTYLCRCAMKSTDLYEAHYNKMHSAPILSGTYSSALEKGRDLYCGYAAKYNNSSVNAIGLGTAVDSLAAIRKLVFEDKRISLERLVGILRSNWDGEEALRLLIRNKYPKFGLGDEKTDATAKSIVDALSDAVRKKPNVKGGVYRLGLFSIDWRWEFGSKTAASADGRLSGETLSQNTSATFGADREGATAHLISVAAIDASRTPNGAIADIDLHSSSVCGENGIKALTATLKAYFELGGFAVHYNILDTEVLKKARLDPANYPNLQVRLCGWNVLFSSLSDKEKDEFISRSERA